MKKMMMILTLSSLCFVISASEQEKGERFNGMKAKLTSHIDQKIQLLSAHKNCINSASDKAALKDCRKKNKEGMEKLKDEAKAGREKFKKERSQRKEERKSKRANKTEEQ